MRPLRFHAASSRGGFADYARRLPALYAAVDAPEAAEILVLEAGFHHLRIPEGLAEPAVGEALRRGALLLLDSSREGRRFVPDQAGALQAALYEAGGRPERSLLLTQNTLLGDAWARWAAERPGQPSIRVHVLHAYLHALAHRTRIGVTEGGPAALAWQGHEADPRFLCLNRRPATHRSIILGHLQRSGALGRGLVSALRAPGGHDGAPRWAAGLEGCVDAFRDLLPLLPLRLPEAPGRNQIMAWDENWYRSTAFSLVTESDFAVSTVRRFTEKSLKPLIAGHPMLLVAAPGTLALLRDQGFRSFAPHINEEYDSLTNPAARMSAVLAEFDRLMAMPGAVLRAVIEALAPTLAHNMAWFRGGLASRLQEEDRGLHALMAGMLDQADAAA